MIPKIIHYCWFGKGLMPKSQKDCVKSWKKILPEYKFILWDESNFDIGYCSYTKSAYEAKKFAFVSDVARCKALYEMGGIYLDTDVEVFEKFDPYLDVNFFSAIEIYNEFYTQNIASLLDGNGLPLEESVVIPHLEILTSTIGCEPGNRLIKDTLDYYVGLNADINFPFFSIDRLIPKLAVKYGFRYVDEKQILQDNMVIYPTGIFGHAFCVNPKYSVTYHYNAASWLPKTKKDKRLMMLDKLHLMGVYNGLRTVRRRLKKMIQKN